MSWRELWDVPGQVDRGIGEEVDQAIGSESSDGVADPVGEPHIPVGTENRGRW
jgi:hypothetical protein